VSELVLINGRTVPAGEARVPVDDRGLLYGDGLFETLRVRGGRPFRLDRHVARLFASCGELAIDPAVSPDMLAVSAAQLVEANAVSSGVLRIQITRGRGAGPDIPDDAEPTVLVTATSGRLYPAELYERGLRAVTAGFPRNERSPLVRHKTTNYLECVLARREAKLAGCDEAVMLNTVGRVAEAAASNIFLVTDGRLVTPPPQEGLLPGITRADVMELARAEGVEVIERPVRPEELREADEVFLTNSVLEVCGLAELDGEAVGGGARDLTTRLAEAYAGLASGEAGP